MGRGSCLSWLDFLPYKKVCSLDPVTFSHHPGRLGAQLRGYQILSLHPMVLIRVHKL